MKQPREANVNTNSKPAQINHEVRIKKMTPADVKGASEKNKTLEDAPAPREEQAP